MKKKYLIFDLDGTLIDNQTKEFFDGVESLLGDLSKDYILFLSTLSSDETVKEVLKNVGIYDLFEVAMGSSVIEKGPKHIETFELVMDDKDFNQKAIFIGDGETDRALAYEAGIAFIKIGKMGEDRYELDSVLELEDILKKVK